MFPLLTILLNFLNRYNDRIIYKHRSTFVKIIVLDRDGVINQDSDNYIKNVDEWMPEKGSIDAIVRLKKAGWTVAVATNQSGIKRGFYSQQMLSVMHAKMNSLLGEFGVDWLNFSPYMDDDNSVCRKPAIGLMRAIELRFDVCLHGKYMVGDSMSDIKVARKMGMVPLLVRTGKGEKTIASLSKVSTDVVSDEFGKIMVFDNLLAAVESIL